jgi:hypothetical protein
MRAVLAGTLALALVTSAIPAVAQQPRDAKPAAEGTRASDSSKLGSRSVTGVVKKTTDTGFVLVGHESGQKDKEWAFATDGATRVNADGKTLAARDLREGDAVTVTYTNRDGKIIAQSVKVNPK